MKKQIVILGAGFGGLAVALNLIKRLRKLKLLDEYQVLLIDKNDYHTYTPLLYEIATTSEAVAGFRELCTLASFSLASIGKRRGFSFMRAQIGRMDFDGGNIFTTDGRNIGYDFLVVALGGKTNYFGIEGLAENSVSLKTLSDALRIREKVSTAMALHQPKDVRVVVVGAGSTGVELAGDLQLWLFGKAGGAGRVFLLGESDKPLNNFPPKVVMASTQRLNDLHIELAMNCRLEKVDEAFLYFNGGEKMRFDVLVWAGGIGQLDVLLDSDASKDVDGQVFVNEFLEILPKTENDNFRLSVYGIGDGVVVSDKTGRPAPLVAPEAISQANTVCVNILNVILKKDEKIRHEVREWPYIIPIGGKWATAKIGRFIFSGFLAWVFKGLVEYRYLLSVLGWFDGTRFWVRGLLVFLKSDRLG
ncbi:MAG: hypothetical protein COU10_00750 [Candidatus Harrisonbacteria bacterium CG10_big_fil_rev_8_21_14_0_10_45_28]|uniref:FAD/NAD(P)-binding domain-containing protein n=1 Tax=Candidatus Harrisonbacteria bacterium CG10_big_fil_rev_8_21_14_0_10_45_28 TaxID=1974586 RepID=A0A2H0UP13_9BACT|nr:MAG: hypothetical protein COU10_00750 [Candidatus Harrisonbacteria bacterium CG10_big_fil_rev_8_21_14_0_10_45_28]